MKHKDNNSVTFNVDHLKLDRGIYLAMTQTFSDISTFTFDLRLRKPYTNEVLTISDLHTYEHVFATALRSIPPIFNGYYDYLPIYFGPMGCQTGFYLVIQLDSEFANEKKLLFDFVSSLLTECLSYINLMKEVPANNPIQCGNFNTLGNMEQAKCINRELSELLSKIRENKCFDQYAYL